MSMGRKEGEKKKGREKHEQKVENMTISWLKRITKMGYGVMDNEFGLNKAIVLGAYGHVPPTYTRPAERRLFMFLRIIPR